MKRINRKKLVPRQQNFRDSRLFIIATEGEITEGQYFGLFQSTRVQVKILPTSNGRSAPNHVLDRLDDFKGQYELNEEDELWLVCDVDQWGSRNLSDICRKARTKGYNLAISNPCFEVWLCLHFQDLDHRDKTCTDFKKRLREILGSYRGNNLDLEKYSSNVPEAIDRAKNLTPPSQEYWPNNLGTHVYKLAESIIASIDN
jgi:RloB-like protein